ncbi:uncharacterized protein LOC101744999 [Bombyx mori]|uniref:Uncharacterized protein n=1 Tax=Bombyx mori TaxID=7091 RepID=A0A8R2HP38_BOMMO|nr:uncharacterized protein LOC101744999 [Bombyx mori]XP_021205955.1 uncharacterized protein LOC101744999 [Bombyx mori]
MSSVQEEKVPTETSNKTHVRDIRNTELVSRLLAATPPYLYSALPLQPHAFFFSEMLRSFVNARHGCRPPHYQRRFKRRTHKYFAENETDWRREWPKQEEEKKEHEPRPEVPLELTVEKHARIQDSLSRSLSPKPDLAKSSGSPGPPGRQSTFVDVGTEELPKPAPSAGRNTTDSGLPPSNLILPPPPPMWYPPLYNPQFGVDPLNFFIDLRVSGHIYDRKRVAPDNVDVSQTDDPEKRLGRDFGRRHLSAFSVPVRSNNGTPDKIFNQNKIGKANGTSYVMKNLKRVYDNLNNVRDTEGSKVNNDDEDRDEKLESSDVEDDVID